MSKNFKTSLIVIITLLALLAVGQSLFYLGKPQDAYQSTSFESSASSQPTSVSNSASVSAAPSVVWQATHESGDLSEWSYQSTRRSEQDSGWCERPKKGVSKETAHSGQYSLKMGIQSYFPKSGCRQFRYPEIRTGEPYYYSAWIYLPHNYQIRGWTNLMQIKSKPAAKNGDSQLLWALRLLNRKNGKLYVQLQWDKTAQVPGPTAEHPGGKDITFEQSLKDFPAKQWVHIEMFIKQSDQFEGQIIVWQDGEEIYNLDNIRTTLPDGYSSWSINAYGGYTNPAKFEVYVDDAAISTQRIGTTYNYLESN